MATSKKISQLPSASLPLSGSELVAVVQGGVTKKVNAIQLGTGANPIKVRSTDFTNATNYNNAILVGKDLAIFMNSIGRYLEDDEWQPTAGGMEILIGGFDSTANDYTFFIHIL